MMFNKNLHVAALIAAMMALGAQASLVTSNEVVGAVSAWASTNGKAFFSEAVAVSATPTYGDDGTTVLYWTVKLSNGGAVIASPDTDLDLVVAVLEKYDDNGLPNKHPLPSILKADFQNRLSVISGHGAVRHEISRCTGSGRASAKSPSAGAPSEGEVAVSDKVRDSMAAANTQWAKYGVGAKAGGMRLLSDELVDEDASPYVRCIVDGFEEGGRYTHWNQGAVNGSPCYNKYTPENAVCGCVATAGSAILQFFNCTNDVGTVTGSPTWNNQDVSYPYNTTMAGPIDWSILPKTSFGGQVEGTDKLNSAGYALLGRVAFNMGVLVNMAWDMMGPGTESGAYVSDLPAAFKAFGFKTARYVAYSGKEDTDGAEFFKTIYAQVWCGAPVALSIQGKGGHAVVACGYARDPDGDEFCRVFMGWGGSGDAWYKLPKIDDFTIVAGAVTMIGYQDDAVVPVYGEANVPGVDLVLPGYVTNGVPVTVPVNENGFFGIRVPPSITDRTIVYEPRAKSMDITPFDAEVLANESNKLAVLDEAIPDEISFSIMYATVKSTLESGRAVAERDGKALLMVSGLPGTPRTKTLMEYIYYLDDTTDFSNRFVLVFNNIKSPDKNRPDGNPSIGVFDPVGFVPAERWQNENSRLSYNAFIDSELSGETGEVVYTFSDTNAVSMTNDVYEVLDVGYDLYLRNHAGISATVTGVDAGSGTNAPFNVGTVDPGYGIYTNSWTNGEVVVFSAPAVVTNGNEVLACLGWTTNEPFVMDPWTREMVLQPYNEGNSVEMPLSAGDEFTLTWIWEKTHYKVTASTTLPNSVEGSEDAVTPAESWVRAGDRIMITAKPETGHRYFSSWEVNGSADYAGEANTPVVLAAALSENGTSVWFCVNEPVTVKANYSGRSVKESTPCALVLETEPKELAEGLKASSIRPRLGEATEAAWRDLNLDWGTNMVVDTAFRFEWVSSSYYVDATNGLWLCKSASFKNIEHLTGSIRRAEDPSEPMVLTYKWELQETPPEEYTLVLVAEPKELEAATPPLEGTFSWGTNILYDSKFTFCNFDSDSRATYTDSTGGVWKCTGRTFSGNVNESGDECTILSPLTPVVATLTWEPQNPEPPEPPQPPAPEPPTPEPISFTSIVQEDDGSWTLTIDGAVKDCWYWLYSTDDLSNFAGDFSAWTADKATTTEDNPQKAVADGDIVFHATGGGNALFWRARATSTEDGN